MTNNFLPVFLFLINFANADLRPKSQPERQLFENLFKDYDRNARPVETDTQGEFKVRVGLTLKRIVEMNVKEQVLTAYFWIMQEWNDPFLRWDPQEYANISSLTSPSHSVWIPDLELYNSADDKLSLSDGVTNVIIKSDGNVSWIEPKEMRAICPVSVFYFPFDTQTCSLQIGSWTLHGHKMDLEVEHALLDVLEFPKSGDEHWWVVNATMNKSSVTYSCCPEPYVDVRVEITLKRKPGHYVLSQILPACVMSLVSLISARWSPQTPMRLLMELVVLLTFLEVVWDVAGEIPVSSGATPLLVVYLVLMIMLSCAGIVVTAIIWTLMQSSPRRKPMPQWLQKWVTGGTDAENTTRDDIPLTQYAETGSLTHININGEIPGAGGSGSLSARTQRDNNGGTQWILLARKMEFAWLRTYTVTTILANFITFFILIL